jgi:hypothetical protein
MIQAAGRLCLLPIHPSAVMLYLHDVPRAEFEVTVDERNR